MIYFPSASSWNPYSTAVCTIGAIAAPVQSSILSRLLNNESVTPAVLEMFQNSLHFSEDAVIDETHLESALNLIRRKLPPQNIAIGISMPIRHLDLSDQENY